MSVLYEFYPIQTTYLNDSDNHYLIYHQNHCLYQIHHYSNSNLIHPISI